jgi:hypothetical protein
VGALILARWEAFMAAGTIMLGNLARNGDWDWFWFFASGLVLVTLVFYGVRRHAAQSAMLLYAIAQFLVVALVVHGISHPGHPGFTDSFNRVAFHSVPLIWWLFGSMLGAAVAGVLPFARGTEML